MVRKSVLIKKSIIGRKTFCGKSEYVTSEKVGITGS